MKLADRDRLEKCLVLAERGDTSGERAAALAAAERIAAGAGTTLAEAKAQIRADRSGYVPQPPQPHSGQPVYRRSRPKGSARQMTVEELLRQKAETTERRRRQTVVADRVRMKDYAAEATFQAEQRAAQAERDRVWFAARGK